MKKRIISIILVLVIVLSATTIASATQLSAEAAFPGRIAIVTNSLVYGTRENSEGYYAAQKLVERFGEDNVLHMTWPAIFWEEGEQMVSILLEIAEDPEIRALIINEAVQGTNAAVDALLEVRDDIFIVYGNPAENAADVASRADLVIDMSIFSPHVSPLIAEAFVMQAVAMGAKTIVHYSFPRHMDIPMLAGRRDVIRDASAREGIEFVEVDAPDPVAEGADATQAFIIEDVPRQVEEFGVNTAFIGTNCPMMPVMVPSVMAAGAIFVQPCCLSPYHAMPTGMGITAFGPANEEETAWEITVGLADLISAFEEVVADAGMSGRVSSWAVPGDMMIITIGFMYAVEWLNGNVSEDNGVIKLDTLSRLAREYAAEFGLDAGVQLQQLAIDGDNFDNFILGIVDHNVLGERTQPIAPTPALPLPAPIPIDPSQVRVAVNGRYVIFEDQGPEIVGGRTLVPARGVFEALGFNVNWNSEAQQATIVSWDRVVVVTAGSATFTANGVSNTLEVPAQIIGGRIMLPYRAILESIGYTVQWDEASRTVRVST